MSWFGDNWKDLLDVGISAAGTGFGIINGQNAADMAADYNQMAADQYGRSSKLAEKYYDIDLEKWKRYKDLYGPLEAQQIEDAAIDLGLNRGVKDAQGADYIADLEAMRPLKDEVVEDTLSDLRLYRPLKDEQVSNALADLALYRPLKDRSVEAQVRALDRDQELYEPLERKMVGEAMDGLNEEQMAAKAAEDVRSGFGMRERQNIRDLSRMGVNPNSGRYNAVKRMNTVDQAAQVAKAKNDARFQAKNTNLSRMQSGLGYRGTNPTQTPTNINAPSFSMPNSTAPTTNSSMNGQYLSSLNPGNAGTVASAAAGFGNLAGQQWDNAANNWSGAGQAAGFGMNTLKNWGK